DRVGVEPRPLVVADVAALIVGKEHEPRVVGPVRRTQQDPTLVAGGIVLRRVEKCLDAIHAGEQTARGNVDRSLGAEQSLRRAFGPGDLVQLRRGGRGQEREANGEMADERARGHATSSWMRMRGEDGGARFSGTTL